MTPTPMQPAEPRQAQPGANGAPPRRAIDITTADLIQRHGTTWGRDITRREIERAK